MTQTEWRIPILTYHSLDSSGSVISTSPEKFRDQMRFLATSSFRVLKLSEIASAIRQRSSVPENAVVISFDDGIKNVYDDAFHILKEYGFPASVFLVTEYCGKNNQWNGQPAEIPKLDLLTWDHIEEMAANGIEFGVHTATHPNLLKVSHDQLVSEILGARETIAERTGRKDQAFAYPYGKSSMESRRLVETNFYAACSTELDQATPGSDLYFLPRIDMYYFSTNDRFSTIGTSSFQRFIKIRKTLRLMKNIVATA
jgi:peptidoglycan/xylan/chitin deacetylase (PgdA/CDA1 family)